MSNAINIITFIVLTTMMVVYMFRYSARLKNPINSTQYLLLEGTEMFFVLLMATGTLALSSSAGGHGAGSGFNLQAIHLLVLEALLLLSYFVASKKPQWSPGAVMYLLYILWLVYSLTYTPSVEYGIRYVLKYIYPLLIMLAASAIVKDEEVFLGVCVWARRVALISALVVFFIPVIRYAILPSFFWYETALTIHYVTIAIISFALFFFYGRDWKDLALAIIFVFPTIISVHRTGLLAMFAGMAVFAFYKWRWVSLPYIVGVLAIGMAIVFYVPSFHEKMFWRDTEQQLSIGDLREGNITEEDIRNNGRKALWETLEYNFYKGRELKGSGIGSCQLFLYGNPDIAKQTHGDYIQMRCDTGLVGMWLYIAVAVVCCIHCLLVVTSRYNPDYIKCCAMITAGAIVGNYAAMYSDNAVTYTMATTGYPFAFYGMMVGMLRRVQKPIEQLSANTL
ncbi:MAG: O-antigen ligase family protein [Bacteroidales bacterium]|nr:O-antigen ligase family protein [Bacteroidales bacterium]